MKITSTLLTIFLLLLFSGHGIAQQRTIRGTVTSAKDQISLPGVTVTVKGTTLGTITDLDGKYQIQVNSNDDILVFSFLGKKPAEVIVGNRAEINIALEDELLGLDEVVVMGYGTQRRDAVTGAVQVITSERIQQIPIASFDQILQGQSAGVNAVSNTGRPGAAAKVTIRGIGSLNADTDPLYVIDGIPMNEAVSDFVNPLSSINPNDIETVTVLKDASAASIYGSRAANGVILVTTKRGQVTDRSEITYRAQYGVSTLARENYNMMNTNEKLDYEILLGIRDENSPLIRIDSLRRINTNWKDVMFRDGLINSHELSSRGGNEKTRYFISGSYFYQDGILQRSNYDRITGRLNLDHFVSDKIKFGTSLTMGYEKYDWSVDAEGGYSNNVYNPIFAAYLLNPYEQPRDEDGEWITTFDTYFGNPLRELELNLDENNTIKLIGNVFAEYQPIENLWLRSSLGTDFYDYTYRLYYNPNSVWGSSDNGSISKGLSRINTRTFSNTARYSFLLNRIHNINLLGGIETTKHYTESFSGSGQGFPNDKLNQPGVSTVPTGFGGGLSEWSMLSYIGSLNYSLMNKYFVDVTFRRDGSSRFGPDTRYANFWSAGVNWNAKAESFLQNLNWLNKLRIRSSIGTTGNFNIGNYSHIGLYGFGLSYNDQPGSAPSNPGDPTLTWEESMAYNVGLEFGFFDRITTTIELYKRTTEKMLQRVPLSLTTGFEQAWRNIGSMYNRGIEATTDVVVMEGDFKWNIGGNIAYNQNKITALYYGIEEFVEPNTSIIYQIGYPYGSFYDNEFAGINPATGNALWYDKDGNITDEFREGDAKIIDGKLFIPPVTGGFSTSLGYKNIHLDAFFSFVHNKYMVNNTRFFIESHGMFATYGQNRNLLNHWKNPGDLTSIPNPFNSAVNNQFDTRLIENASFLRLRNLTISYTLPNSVTNRFFGYVQSLRVYAQGQNVLTWSPYSGFDPEQDGWIELSAYPAVRTISIGLDLGI
jgi:TonB-linked SusC/RagA family outer membrane protein